MVSKIDFNSDEATYIQLHNQTIMSIVTDMIRERDSLPSVQQMADHTGINIHTVSKAYTVLKQEGSVKLDHRRGAVVSPDIDKIRAIGEVHRDLDAVLTRGACKNITRQEIHQLINEIFDKYAHGCMGGEGEAEEN